MAAAIRKPERNARDDAQLEGQIAVALRGEPFLGQCSIDGLDDTPRAMVLFPEGAAGLIEIVVVRGRATLRGRVQSAAQRELAAVIAARVPGCHAVINALAVVR